MNAQLTQLFIAYGVTAGAMLVCMWLMGSDKRGYFRWPLYSAVALFLGVFGWNWLRRHAMPPEWELTHPALMYYGALGMYALLGAGIGLLVGAVTRTKNAFAKDIEPPTQNEKS